MSKSKKKIDDFTVISNSSGIFIKEPGSKKENICPPLRIASTGRYEGSDTQHIILKFTDLDGNARSIVHPRSDLLKRHTILEHLADANFDVPTFKEDRQIVMAYLNEEKPKKRTLLTRRVGWHEKAFVTTSRIYGSNRSQIERQLPKDHPYGMFKSRGSLKDWHGAVAIPALNSSRLMFAIGAALAAPLLKLMNVESGGFHFVGESSTGKTTTLLIGQSVWGRPQRDKLLTWDITSTSIEEVADAHSDILLCIDEFARLADTELQAARKAQDIAYTLAGCQGRSRSKQFSRNSYRQAEWHILFLSTGETGISETSAAAGVKRLAGNICRFVDIPAEVHQDWGIFEKLPKEIGNSNDAIQKIDTGSMASYGKAGKTFLKLITEDAGKVRMRVKSLMEKFLSSPDLPELGGWEARFAKRFALIYAASVLAAEYDILPWPPHRIMKAIMSCYLDARKMAVSNDPLVQKKLMKLKRRLKNRAKILDFTKTKSASPKSISRAFGVKLNQNSKVFFAVKPRRFRKLVGDGMVCTLLLRSLQRDGHLVTQESADKLSKPVAFAGRKRKRYYCISEAFLKSD